MRQFRVATWNMDSWKRSKASREFAWRWLQETVRPDIALLQEAIPLEGVGQVVWKGDGIDRNRPWASAVVSFGPAIKEVRRWKGRYDRSAKDLHQTYPGTLAIAMIELLHRASIVVVSMYGMLDDGYASTTVHRLITDLNPLLDSTQGKRVIIGGDLNCSTQFDQPYGRIHQNLFERFEAYGLVNLTRATRNQRSALDDCPCEEAPDCGHVRTQRHRRSDKPWQTDYILASHHLAGKVIGCEVVDEGSPNPWGFSDHCPIVATFGL